jgi:hypothetical protein
MTPEDIKKARKLYTDLFNKATGKNFNFDLSLSIEEVREQLASMDRTQMQELYKVYTAEWIRDFSKRGDALLVVRNFIDTQMKLCK